MSMYYNPEDFGLEVFGSLDQPDMDYEFNTLAVWKRTSDGQLFYAQDSG